MFLVVLLKKDNQVLFLSMVLSDSSSNSVLGARLDVKEDLCPSVFIVFLKKRKHTLDGILLPACNG